MRNATLIPHLVFTALAGVALANLGCSGDVFSSRGGEDAGDAAPTEDASPTSDGSPAPDASPSDASTGPCPASLPARGTGCTASNLECEYGQSEYPGCDTIVQCTSGTWQSWQPGVSFCPSPNGADCPASISAANGSSCELGPGHPVSCFYSTGGCYCGSLGGPVPIEVDGATVPQKWQCDDPGPKCPLPRPRLGSACSAEGQDCNYLQCAFDEICTGGLWTGQPEGCAVAGIVRGP
jgi:hypothetical protein